MGIGSFYHSTNRQRVDGQLWDKAKLNYSLNYCEYLPADKRAKVVEFGCSEGNGLEWLVDQGYTNVTGVDTDSVAIELAQHRMKIKNTSAEILCMDILDFATSQPDCSFDVVIMFNVIEHISKQNLLRLIPEIARIIRPDGIFLTQTGNIENPFNFGLFARDFTHHIPFTSNSLRQLMIMCGFKPDSVRVMPVRYITTSRNLPLQLLGTIMGFMLKAVAFSMRARIQETAPLIYCVARKVHETE